MTKNKKLVLALVALLVNTAIAISLHVFFYTRFMTSRWSMPVTSISAMINALILMAFFISLRMKKRDPQSQESHVS
jgi:protein-S-isoprenylcysteine O-methyltransferase Ste14